jgi:hypothetical protein
LIAAYGRERHEGRLPSSSWWVTRLCVMPFLAIVVVFAADQFSLTRQQYALLAALLSLSGYEAVRIIIDRAQRRGTALVDSIIPATAKPYASKIETDGAGHPVARLMVYDPEHPRSAGVGDALRSGYSGAVQDELPVDQTDLLGEIDKRTTDADRDAS